MARVCPSSALKLQFAFLIALLISSVLSSLASETVLHAFNDAPGGAFPYSNLIADSAGNMYATTSGGGAYGWGTVFSLTPASNGKWMERVLYSFTGGNDGSGPLAGLTLDSAGNLYGATYEGGNGFGNQGPGVIFRLSPGANGKWTETVLYTFRNSSDGSTPRSSVILDAAGNLYGTADGGGAAGVGTVFELSPTAQGEWLETTLHSFTDGFDGAYPDGPLIFDGAGHLFGTTAVGGDSNCNNSQNNSVGCGVIFELTKNSDATWAETTLHAFNYADGAFPLGKLARDADGNLYGTTNSGPSYQCANGNGCGTVYRLSLNAGIWTLTTLYQFAGGTDGGNPAAGLILDAQGNLYGTTQYGGESSACALANCGTVFELIQSTNPVWKEKVLHRFSYPRGYGLQPASSLTFDKEGNLYGTATEGGAACSILYTQGCGSVFKLSPTSGGAWTSSLISIFPGVGDGLQPQAGLVADSAGNLYGATQNGGATGGGVVFETSRSKGHWTEHVIYTFNGNTEGGGPSGSLVFDTQGNLYGTAVYGGDPTCSCGVVFKLSPTGNGQWQETVIYKFRGAPDGADPYDPLTFDFAGNLYGTTQGGGQSSCYYAGCGTVFKLSPTSSGLWNETVLHRFQANSDGYGPSGPLLLDAEGDLYGATTGGGSASCGLSGCGTIYTLISTLSGPWTEKILHRFRGGSDGSHPTGVVFGTDGSLYGTTSFGGRQDFCGTAGCGTVFRLTPGSNGWSNTVLYAFDPFKAPGDGTSPLAPPVFDSAGNLYGTTSADANLSCVDTFCGTVFQLTPSTSGQWTETVLAHFNFWNGSYPQSPVILDTDGNLFGTTYDGGTDNNGVVFEVTPGLAEISQAPIMRALPYSLAREDRKPRIFSVSDFFRGIPRGKAGQ